MANSNPKILVTGGNAGIGFALCKQLASRGCHVYLCSRSVERGEAAVKALLDENPAAKVELVQCDTADDASVAAAAAAVKASLCGETLFAIVNNAGVNRGADIINTNVYGPKRVCEAFAPLWQASGGRIVNLGSGGGPSFVVKHPQHRELMCSWDTTWEQCEAMLRTEPWSAGANVGPPDISAAEWTCYCCSKAALHVYTRVLAKQYPDALCSTGELGTAPHVPSSRLLASVHSPCRPVHAYLDGAPSRLRTPPHSLAWLHRDWHDARLRLHQAARRRHRLDPPRAVGRARRLGPLLRLRRAPITAARDA